MTTKRLQAITGDRITLSHPTLGFERGATTSVTVIHGGITYNVTSMPPGIAHDLSVVTGEYGLANGVLRVRESVDTLQIGASAVRYHNLWESDSGSLTVLTHDHHEEGLDLLSLMAPVETALGVRVHAKDGVEVVSPPSILCEARPLGLLQISPLTPSSLAALPDWQGTPVKGGELFAANLSRTVPYLILVSDTARVDISLFDTDDLDTPAELASELEVIWSP